MLHFLKIYKEKHLQISLSKSWWYDLQFLRYRAKHTEIGNFRSFFALLPPKDPQNKVSKKWKNLLQISSFTRVPKITAYDVWFPRHGVWQTECFVIMDRSLPFYSPMDPENQNFEKIKKALKILFYKCLP